MARPCRAKPQTLNPKPVARPCGEVLRDPLERLFSQYAYLCLEGSEDRSGWTVVFRV